MEISSGKLFHYERKYNLPVVFLPGIMGSRLRINVNGDVVPWEPDSPFTSISRHFVIRSAKTVRNRLDPANNTDFPQDLPGPTSVQLLQVAPMERRREYERMRGVGGVDPGAMRRRFESDVTNHLIDKGWNEVSWNFYGEFLVHLRTHEFQGGDCPVYAVGYDWRGTNEESAQRLNDRIQDIKEEEDADQVVVVTHSMGGLVARSFVEQYGENDVQAIIHITQPTYGAPILYRRFRTGGTDGSIKWIIGGEQEDAATILSIVDGVLELLPTASYRMKRTDQYSTWLSWPEWWIDGEQPPQDMNMIYRQSTDHLGIVPPDFEFRQNMEKRISSAISFQNSIDEVFHSNTYWISSEGANTDVAVRIEPLNLEEMMSSTQAVIDILEDTELHDFEDQDIRVLQYMSEKGDGTVPLDSQLGYEMKPGVHEPKEVTRVQEVEHDQACTDDAVQQKVTEWVQTIISNYARQCLPKEPL